MEEKCRLANTFLTRSLAISANYSACSADPATVKSFPFPFDFPRCTSRYSQQISSARFARLQVRSSYRDHRISGSGVSQLHRNRKRRNSPPLRWIIIEGKEGKSSGGKIDRVTVCRREWEWGEGGETYFCGTYCRGNFKIIQGNVI